MAECPESLSLASGRAVEEALTISAEVIETSRLKA